MSRAIVVPPSSSAPFLQIGSTPNLSKNADYRFRLTIELRAYEADALFKHQVAGRRSSTSSSRFLAPIPPIGPKPGRRPRRPPHAGPRFV
jgi:hypothetical protein